MKVLKVGDLVGCASSYPFIQSLNLQGRTGIVLETRRDNCRVFYDALKQSFWLPNEFLKKVVNVEARGPLQKLNRLLSLVNASECELELRADDYVLNAYTQALSYHAINEIKEYLGEDFRNLMVYPHGMAKMIVAIEFR